MDKDQKHEDTWSLTLALAGVLFIALQVASWLWEVLHG